MKKLSRLLLAFLIIFFTACNDDDDPAVLTNTQLITAAPWLFSSLSTGDATLDTFFSALFTGFSITFAADGTYTVTILGITEPGTWRFNVEETQFVLDEGTMDESVSNIITLNTTTFVFTFTEDLGTPTVLTITTTH